MVETVITITVADLAALDWRHRDLVLAAVGYVWDARAKNLQLAPITNLALSIKPDSTPDSASPAVASPPAAGRSGAAPIEPGAIPEPVEAPRAEMLPPDGAPGDSPWPADDVTECPKCRLYFVRRTDIDPVAHMAACTGPRRVAEAGAYYAPEDAKQPDSDSDCSDSSTLPDVPKSESIAASTMTEAEQAAWEAAMRAGVRVTDDGPPPAPVDETPPPAPKQSGHYGRTLILCEQCGKGYGRGAGMAAHMRSSHPDTVAPRSTGQRTGDTTVTLASRPPQPLPGERWAHTCDRCQRTFPGERTLEEHERTCTGLAS